MIASMRPPPWQIEQWLNTDEELSLENLKGVLVTAVQKVPLSNPLKLLI